MGYMQIYHLILCKGFEHIWILVSRYFWYPRMGPGTSPPRILRDVYNQCHIPGTNGTWDLSF